MTDEQVLYTRNKFFQQFFLNMSNFSDHTMSHLITNYYIPKFSIFDFLRSFIDPFISFTTYLPFPSTQLYLFNNLIPYTDDYKSRVSFILLAFLRKPSLPITLVQSITFNRCDQPYNWELTQYSKYTLDNIILVQFSRILSWWITNTLGWTSSWSSKQLLSMHPHIRHQNSQSILVTLVLIRTTTYIGCPNNGNQTHYYSRKFQFPTFNLFSSISSHLKSLNWHRSLTEFTTLPFPQSLPQTLVLTTPSFHSFCWYNSNKRI